MLIRREYAPTKSPTSFSKGGGFRNGSAFKISSSFSTWERRLVEEIFLASFCACFVKKSSHVTSLAILRICLAALSIPYVSSRACREWIRDRVSPECSANPPRKLKPHCCACR